MARKEMAVDSVAEAYLTLLAERGVEYLFANAGTDFAPLVEAFAKAARTGAPAPKPILATHENSGVVDGAWLGDRRPAECRRSWSMSASAPRTACAAYSTRRATTCPCCLPPAARR